MNIPESFYHAQREYDNQLPTDDEDLEREHRREEAKLEEADRWYEQRVDREMEENNEK